MPSRRIDSGGVSDPIGAYSFRVEIDGILAGRFKAVDGLEGEIEVVEFQDGDELIVRKRPGRTRWGDITLIGGYVNNPVLFDWWTAASEGQYTRKNMSIILLDQSGDPSQGEIRRWNCFECWPRAWRLGRLDSSESVALVESITIVTEFVEHG